MTRARAIGEPSIAKDGAPVHAGRVARRDRGHAIVSGNMWKAAKIRAVLKLRFADVEGLTTADRDIGGVADREREFRRAPQFYDVDAGCAQMVLDFEGKAAVRSGGEAHDAIGKPVRSEGRQARDDDIPRDPGRLRDRGSMHRRIRQIDAAFRIAEHGRTGPLIDSADRLVEAGTERAKFGREGEALPFDLAEIALRNRDALRRIGPIDPEQFDGRIIVAAGEKVGLVDRQRRQRARRGEIVDREAEALLNLRRGESARRLERRFGMDDIFVMLGEAEDNAITTPDAPAIGERRRATREMGGQRSCKSLQSEASGREARIQIDI